MGFTLVETRSLDEAASVRQSLPNRSVGSSSAQIPSFIQAANRGLWLLTVVLAHLLAFWLLRAIRADTPEVQEVAALVVTNIPAIQQPDTQSVPPEAAAEASETEIPELAPQPPSEWAVARIPVPVAAALVPAPANIAAARSVGPPASSVYDPYAGVAPLRRSSLGQPTTTPAVSTPTSAAQDHPMGPATSARLAKAVAARAPTGRGSAEIRAWVSPHGVVVRVDVLASDISDQARIVLIDEARKLKFGPGTERIIRSRIAIG